MMKRKLLQRLPIAASLLLLPGWVDGLTYKTAASGDGRDSISTQVGTAELVSYYNERAEEGLESLNEQLQKLSPTSDVESPPESAHIEDQLVTFATDALTAFFVFNALPNAKKNKLPLDVIRACVNRSRTAVPKHLDARLQVLLDGQRFEDGFSLVARQQEALAQRKTELGEAVEELFWAGAKEWMSRLHLGRGLQRLQQRENTSAALEDAGLALRGKPDHQVLVALMGAMAHAAAQGWLTEDQIEAVLVQNVSEFDLGDVETLREASGGIALRGLLHTYTYQIAGDGGDGTGTRRTVRWMVDTPFPGINMVYVFGRSGDWVYRVPTAQVSRPGAYRWELCRGTTELGAGEAAMLPAPGALLARGMAKLAVASAKHNLTGQMGGSSQTDGIDPVFRAKATNDLVDAGVAAPLAALKFRRYEQAVSAFHLYLTPGTAADSGNKMRILRGLGLSTMSDRVPAVSALERTLRSSGALTVGLGHQRGHFFLGDCSLGCHVLDRESFHDNTGDAESEMTGVGDCEPHTPRGNIF